MTAVCVQVEFLKWVGVYYTTKSMTPWARNLLVGGAAVPQREVVISRFPLLYLVLVRQ